MRTRPRTFGGEAGRVSVTRTFDRAARCDPDGRRARVADALARLPAHAAEVVERATTAFVVEELLDNAVRDAHGARVRLKVTVGPTRISVRTTNDVPAADLPAVLRHFEQLVATDPQAALVARAEANAIAPAARAGLGLLTLRADYGVALDVRVRPSARPGFSMLEVRATWPRERVGGT